MGIGGIEHMDIGTLAFGLLPERDAIFVADLFDGIQLSSCTGFVTLDIVAGNEDTVTGNDLTGFEEGDVTGL